MPEIEVWDKRSGEKVPHLVPAKFVEMFDYLSATPKQKQRESAAATTTPKAPAEAKTKE